MSGRLRDTAPDEEGSGESRTSGVMPRARLDSWRVPEPPAHKLRDELPPMTATDLAIAATELAQPLASAPSEHAIAERFVGTLAAALPGRLLALRIEAPGGPAIATNVAGPLPEVPLRTSRAAAELFDLDAGFEIAEEHATVCPDADHGFDLPILTESGGARRVLGTLHVEYAKGARPRSGELAPLLPLLAMLTMAIEAVRARRERDADRSQVAGLVRATAVPAFLLDGAGTVLAASEGAAELMRKPLAELVGRKATDVAPDGTGAAVAEGVRRSRSGETIPRLEMRTSRSAGARVIWTVVPAADADGAIHATVAVGKDLTVVSQLEDQIVHAEKLATLGQLAAGVVHELNNPLTSISVYTDYLVQKGRRTGGDPADLERLGRIAEAAARMLRFTRDLVTYARPSTEEPSPVAIGEVLAQSAGFCEHVLRDANVTLTLHAPPSLPAVRGLRGQLQQVFVNLYTNAAHAIAERPGGRGGNIDVSVTIEGDSAVVRVADDGPGIRSEHRSKVFEPFFSTKTEGRGTGLGLSIVRNIVRLHGGGIEVDSRHRESGHDQTGTTFVVRLPLVGQ